MHIFPDFMSFCARDPGVPIKNFYKKVLTSWRLHAIIITERTKGDTNHVKKTT